MASLFACASSNPATAALLAYVSFCAQDWTSKSSPCVPRIIATQSITNVLPSR
ncbi:hypothetical protein PAMC26510_05890 [Caballeronia sordidicola]|uniref:Uncharacterized protein n=1 Tax=Caballeronia sordidicola TaxID=196367 RepID=A0A242N6W1_CABSO|nr:hypothetical protein PAMC26510_05890 [Caballeronia sordidicola]